MKNHTGITDSTQELNFKQGEIICGEPLTEKARRRGVEDPSNDCHTLMGTSSLWGINLT